MAELVDYLFLFWFVLTGGVFFFGNLYEKQFRIKLKQQAAEEERRKSLLSSGQYSQSAWGSSAPFSSSNNSPFNHDTSHQQTNFNFNFNHLARSSNSQSHYNGDSTHQRQAGEATSDSAHHRSTLAAERTGPYDMTEPVLLSGKYQETSNSRPSYRQTAGGLTVSSLNDDEDPLRSDQQYEHRDLLDASIPTATGFNQDCVDWINSILYLFYSQPQKYGPIISENVYRSLNEKLANITSSSQEYQHLVVEFQGLNHHMSTRPELTNIRTETESEKSVCVNCKIYNRRLMFDLLIRRAPTTKLYKDVTSNLDRDTQQVYYELTLENLEGKLKSVAMLNDKLIVVQFMEKPDTKILLRQKPNAYSNNLNNQTLISEDLLVGIILQALTQVVIDLYFADDSYFPQYHQQTKQQTQSGYRNKLNLLKGGASELKRQIKHDFFGALTSSSSQPNQQDNQRERKVFIRIVRAKNINYNLNATCLLELDQPYQQAISTTKHGSQSNPSWDESFLFNITEKSQFITIELWDSIDSTAAAAMLSQVEQTSTNKKKQTNQKLSNKSDLTSQAKFLGSIRVQVADLRQEPVQKLSLMLQSRTQISENVQNTSGGLVTTDLSDSVGGELELELLFLEHSPGGDTSSSNQTTQAPGSHQQQLHHSNSGSSLVYQQGDVVSVDRKLTQAGYVITTTTITKPAQTVTPPGGKNNNKPLTNLDQLSVVGASGNRAHSPVSSEHSNAELEMIASNNLDGISSMLDNQSTSNQDAQGTGEERRSRSRSRSRSFLRAIKKRFSFSRTRSRSVGGDRSPALSSRIGGAGDGVGDGTHSALGNSQLSIESRSRTSSFGDLYGRAKSVPTTRDPGEVPVIVINKSRLSDTASAFNFSHPKSQLVIECFEPKLQQDGSTKERGQVRHYLIPDDAANKNKWRKRGTKLHIFNEHQFVATHLAGSSTCHLCGRVFSRRPGKQGYKCRNCHLLSHKECHVKVDHICPYATKDALKLDYIDAYPSVGSALAAESAQFNSEHYTSTGNPASGTSGTLPREQHQAAITRSTRLGTKSISMEVDDR